MLLVKVSMNEAIFSGSCFSPDCPHHYQASSCSAAGGGPLPYHDNFQKPGDRGPSNNDILRFLVDSPISYIQYPTLNIVDCGHFKEITALPSSDDIIVEHPPKLQHNECCCCYYNSVYILHVTILGPVARHFLSPKIQREARIFMRP